MAGAAGGDAGPRGRLTPGFFHPEADELAARAVALLERTDAATRPVRLLGVGVHGLLTPEELAVVAPADPQLQLDID